VESGCNVGVTKAQAIVSLLAGRLSTKSKSVEGPKKKVSTPIAREHSARAIGSVGCRCQPQDQQVSRFGSEGGNRFSPVGPIPKCASLFSRHVLTMLDQSRAKSALDDLALYLAPFQNVSFSVSSREHHNICGERDGVEFAKQRRRDVCVHRGGGGTKKSMPSRRHPSG
jgi:hypothetical protein